MRETSLGLSTLVARMGRLVQALRATAQAIGAWRRRAAARRQLEALDERSLRDLGLCRSELDSCWAEARGDVERTRLRVVSSEQ